MKKLLLAALLSLGILSGCSGGTTMEDPGVAESGSDYSTEDSYPTAGMEEYSTPDEPSYEESSELECSHNWSDATCTEPRTCLFCGQTSGKALGHNYSGKYCVRCSASNPNYKEVVEVSYIQMEQYSVTIYVGKQLTLKQSIYPDNAANKKVTWSSSNSGVAKVSQSGVVTGVAPGEATITVKTANGKTDDCKITVKEDVAAKCKLTLPSCPVMINYYSYSGKIYSTTNVTNITYKFEESYDGMAKLLLYFSGEKTYDSQGGGQSSSCKIGWKLYDADNYVVKDGTVYTTSLKMGEKYKDVKAEIYSLKPGAYRLEILNVN